MWKGLSSIMIEKKLKVCALEFAFRVTSILLGYIEEWARIPDNVEILMTHTPPHGILDVTKRGKHAGCEILKSKLSSFENCRLHVFGHIHEGFGAEIRETEKDTKKWETVYVNAAVAMGNLPVIVDLKKP